MPALLLFLLLTSIGAQTIDTSIEVRTVTGEKQQIRMRGTRATVVVFVSAVCPMSVDYGPRLTKMYTDYSDRGVKMLIVNSNVNEPDAEVESQRIAAGVPYPIYRDSNAKLAGKLGANATPTAVVLDGSGIVRYFGSIDDSRNPARVKRENLRLAIEDLLAGRPVQMARSKTLGCTIKAASVP